MQIASYIYNRTRESYIKITKLMFGLCKATSSNQDVKYECFQRDFQIFHIRN